MRKIMKQYPNIDETFFIVQLLDKLNPRENINDPKDAINKMEEENLVLQPIFHSAI